MFYDLILAALRGRPTVLLTVNTSNIQGVRSDDVRIVTRTCDALRHPRTLIGDLWEIAKSFKAILDDLAPKRDLRAKPLVIIQLPAESAGGYTNVEYRAFREAALSAGAKDVRIVTRPIPLIASVIQGIFREPDTNAA